jgi:BMFP domain-containing protein YqiC
MAQGVQDEAKTFMRAQAERVASDMDLIGRDEFEAVKELAARAQDEVIALRERIATLEAALAAKS